ncbi:hypothetical protein BXZ70DRAFT_916664 [Cristinia sonorae]|uniref:Histone H1 n=1 Tax=Cristinia sonorae TaxID=1940300 RepID=A0A8K0XV47_9AGAR|nr:hypothetical protein BXZ70DRAFT_916664 [Cristinia sonorae]
MAATTTTKSTRTRAATKPAAAAPAKKATTSKAKETKVTKAKAAPAAKPAATHPSWKDIIKECIAAHASEARSGVSRATIKKFAEETYKLEMTGLQNSQLNRAIASGAEAGIFSLPKGPSGKVKLAPKVRPNVLKENNQPPAPRKAPASKATEKPTKPVKPTKTTETKTPAKKRATVAKPAAAKKTSSAKVAKKEVAAKAAVKKAVTKAKAVKAPVSKSKEKPKKAAA